MKNLVFIAAFMAMSCTVAAQDYKHLYQEQAELNKVTQKARQAKAGKDAEKMAKKLEKQGWMPLPGKLPLAKQFDRAYNMQVELNDDGRLKYIYGTGQSTANSTAAAQMAAATAAREEIASAMGVSLTALIDDRKQQNQLSAIEASTMDEIALKGKQIFSQDLGRMETVIEAYRVLNNNNMEVMIGIAYSTAEVSKQMSNTIKKAFKDKGLQTASLDEKMGW
jgi:hypothetical protein